MTSCSARPRPRRLTATYLDRPKSTASTSPSKTTKNLRLLTIGSANATITEGEKARQKRNTQPRVTQRCTNFQMVSVMQRQKAHSSKDRHLRRRRPNHTGDFRSDRICRAPGIGVQTTNDDSIAEDAARGGIHDHRKHRLVHGRHTRLGDPDGARQRHQAVSTAEHRGRAQLHRGGAHVGRPRRGRRPDHHQVRVPLLRRQPRDVGTWHREPRAGPTSR